MKLILKILVSLFLFSIIYYLLLPSPAFPPPPPGSLQSQEPADTESIYRRAYFTNLSRQEIMDFYEKQFFGPIQYRLNYPPEEAYTHIRDQTQSSFLEEIIHPLRESLFVNGFVPTKPTEQINRNGVHYLNRVTVRYVPSHPVTRLTVLLLITIAISWLIKRSHA